MTFSCTCSDNRVLYFCAPILIYTLPYNIYQVLNPRRAVPCARPSSALHRAAARPDQQAHARPAAEPPGGDGADLRAHHRPVEPGQEGVLQEGVNQREE